MMHSPFSGLVFFMSSANFGCMQSEKTSVMTTPKCLGAHIWQICLADLPTSQSSINALNTITPNLADLLADLSPLQSSIDALNTVTPNLADLLADLPPINCI